MRDRSPGRRPSRAGWDLTGLDYVPLAIDQARSRATAAGAKARFLVGDVTRLAELDLGPAFDLVFDNKCFHSLPAKSRRSYAAGVAAACRPAGTFLLFALTPGRWRRVLGLPAGVHPDEVQKLFEPDFDFSRREPGKGGPFQPAFYKMDRRAHVA